MLRSISGVILISETVSVILTSSIHKHLSETSLDINRTGEPHTKAMGWRSFVKLLYSLPFFKVFNSRCPWPNLLNSIGTLMLLRTKSG